MLIFHPLEKNVPRGSVLPAGLSHEAWQKR